MADCIISKVCFTSDSAGASVAISLRVESVNLHGLTLHPAGFQMHCPDGRFDSGKTDMIPVPLKPSFHTVELYPALSGAKSCSDARTRISVVDRSSTCC